MAALVKTAEHGAKSALDAGLVRAKLREATADHAPVPSQTLALQQDLVREFSHALPARWPVGLRLLTIAGLAGALWAGLTLLIVAL